MMDRMSYLHYSHQTICKKKIEYELPDGTILTLGTETVVVPEILFREGQPAPAIHQLVSSSISVCDTDIRKELYGGIIVTGGTSLISGFQERLQRNISVPSQHKLKVIAPTESAERRFSSWIGGSILGSLGTMHSMWISRADYEEFGTQTVERKCP